VERNIVVITIATKILLTCLEDLALSMDMVAMVVMDTAVIDDTMEDATAAMDSKVAIRDAIVAIEDTIADMEDTMEDATVAI